MTRRSWCMVLAFPWWALAGCLSTDARGPLAGRRDGNPTVESTPADRVAVLNDPSSASPYHVLPVTPPSPQAQGSSSGASERHNLYTPPPPEEETPAVAIKAPQPPATPATPTPEDPAVVRALRCLLQKHPDGLADADAVAWLQTYAPANQELLLQLLPLVARLTEGPLDRAEPREMAHVVETLESVAAPLRRQAPLLIDRMCYCGKIRKFGDYDAYGDQKMFRPGELIQLYVELRNVVSEPTDAAYETRLATTVEIRDDHGKVVWRLDCPDRNRPERLQTQGHDYFASHLFTLPENFAPGQYTLHLTVADQHTRNRDPARASLALEVTNRP